MTDQKSKCKGESRSFATLRMTNSLSMTALSLCRLGEIQLNGYYEAVLCARHRVIERVALDWNAARSGDQAA